MPEFSSPEKVAISFQFSSFSRFRHSSAPKRFLNKLHAGFRQTTAGGITLWHGAEKFAFFLTVHESRPFGHIRRNCGLSVAHCSFGDSPAHIVSTADGKRSSVSNTCHHCLNMCSSVRFYILRRHARVLFFPRAVKAKKLTESKLCQRKKLVSCANISETISQSLRTHQS